MTDPGSASSRATPTTPATKKKATFAAYELGETMTPSRTLVYRQYGDQPLRLHIFEPANHSPDDARPCLLLLHGGGWRNGTAQTLYALADYFARRGVVAISMEYRLVDDVTPPLVCVHDGRTAVRYLRAHANELGIDPCKVIVGGGSAGAHVAASTALFDGMDAADDDLTISTVPDALVLYYPVLDTSPEGYGNVRCGEHWQDLSPLHQVRAGLPPTIVFHGTADRVTPFVGAQRFQQAMQQAGNTCELVVHEGGIHGYFLCELGLLEATLKRTEDFLISQNLLAGARCS